jgi:putative ATPase
MTASLFQGGGASQPLAARMRPKTLDEVVGQKHLLASGSPLRRLLENPSQTSTSIILWGPPGTGKTTLASLIAGATQASFIELSAISAGVKDVREAIEKADHSRNLYGTTTVLFIDEVHRFSKTQQDALLPAVEKGTVILVAATTENPSFSVVAPLLSRSLVFSVTSLTNDDVIDLVNRAVTCPKGLDDAVSLSDNALSNIVRLSGGDARRALTILEASAAVTLGESRTEVSIDDVAIAASANVVRYDHDGTQHYDVISAFIKSVRGSDVDAALHYLARMLEGGEDPRFIARRLMILASEDIGLADNSMLVLASAGAQTVAMIGMPEGRITLAHVTIALALAPKSNSAYMAINAAIDDVRAGGIGDVPAPLRDSQLSKSSDGIPATTYVYPHNLAEGVAAQQYLPDSLHDREYFKPSGRGHESSIGVLLGKLRELLGRK